MRVERFMVASLQFVSKKSNLLHCSNCPDKLPKRFLARLGYAPYMFLSFTHITSCNSSSANSLFLVPVTVRDELTILLPIVCLCLCTMMNLAFIYCRHYTFKNCIATLEFNFISSVGLEGGIHTQ